MLDTGEPSVLAHRCRIDGSEVMAVHNLADHEVKPWVKPALTLDGPSNWSTCCGDHESATDGRIQFALPPYGCRGYASRTDDPSLRQEKAGAYCSLLRTLPRRRCRRDATLDNAIERFDTVGLLLCWAWHGGSRVGIITRVHEVRRLLRSPARVWLGRLTFAVVLLAALGYLILGPATRLDTAAKGASIIALALGGVTMVLSMRPVHAVVLAEGLDDQIAKDLAILVERQWTHEAAVRLLRRPRPLAVGWSLTERSAAPVAEIFGSAAPIPGLALQGEVADLIVVFRGVPARRLVAVGAPGSGKTAAALLLTLDLLASCRPDEPVPVLLSVSSWDPRERLESWLARRLAEEYPTLTDRRRYGEDALLRLVRAGRVLPVLDGLDEMPQRSRPAAITALNTATAGHPIVVTCRDDAYAEAVATAGTPLDGAAVVRLEPITAAAAAAYLVTGQVDGVRRWANVVSELHEHPDGPLAQALSTPLMVYLARTVYAAPAMDPTDLADPIRFPSRTDIEAHLLDRYLPAIYTVSAIAPDPLLVRATRRYDIEEARTWLTFLAVRLSDSAAGDLAWWRLPGCIARWRVLAGVTTGCVAGLAAGLAAGVATTLVAGPGWGLVGGLAAAVYMSMLCGSAYGTSRVASPIGRPRQLRMRLRTLLSPTHASVVRGMQCAVIVGLQSGLLLGIALGFRQGVDAGIGHGIVAALLIGLPVGVAEFLAQNLTSLKIEPEWVSPRSSLVGDRAASLLHACVGFLIFGFSTGLIVGFLEGIRDGLAAGIAAGVCSAVIGVVLTGFPPDRMPAAGLQWVPFTIARIWLAIRHRIPLHLLRFLEDAHARGVLRQIGAVYQFRHAQVREHLAHGSHPMRHTYRTTHNASALSRQTTTPPARSTPR